MEQGNGSGSVEGSGVIGGGGKAGGREEPAFGGGQRVDGEPIDRVSSGEEDPFATGLYETRVGILAGKDEHAPPSASEASRGGAWRQGKV